MPHRLPLAAVFCLIALPTLAADSPTFKDYPYGPDSQRQANVPQGKVEKYAFTSPKIYEGTVHDSAVYIPAQYDGKEPACVMVFQDGMGFVNEKGAWRIPIVLDNLIAQKAMPITIGVFVSPGVLPPPDDGQKHLPRYDRSNEYDTPNDTYARFLIEEVLPDVEQRFHLNLTKDPNCRAIAGSSSGGIAAFVAAWERPDYFHRVITTVGSYTSLHGGGNNLPALVRKSEPKPLRLYLEDADHDANGYAGNWFLANQEMASALEFAGYDFHFEIREGVHGSKHSGPLMPEMLRFIWRDYPKPIEIPTNKNQPVQQVILPNEDWQVASEGHKFTEGPAVDKDGNVFFTDQWKIWRIDAASGKTTVFVDKAEGANGAMFGPDGRLYAVLGAFKEKPAGSIVAYQPDGQAETIATDVNGNDLCVAHNGTIYVTEPDRKQITWITPKDHAKHSLKVPKIGYANGITLTPDQGQLAVADTQTPNLWAFRVEPDGSLAHGAPFYIAHVPAGQPGSGADGIRVDRDGRLYAATAMGVQVFDQAGRVIGILNKPQRQWLANVVLGGPKFDVIYACCGDKVFKRRLKVTGSNNWDVPTLPEKPKL